jgi:tol-pal system protein YbgF
MAGAAAAGAGVAAVPKQGEPKQGEPKQGEPDPTQLYDQATADLTQGRYAMALGNYREYLRKFPDTELADNAQYGAGECFFAQAQFDSALVEYARVGAQWGSGDRAPAALYKLGLCQEHLGHAADAKKTFESLVKRFPQSGESQLARDRIAAKP